GRGRRMDHTQTSLLRRVRDAGDHTSWGEFVALYYPLLRRLVRRHGLADHDAEDVVQNVFVRLQGALPGFECDRGGGRFRTWLTQVCVHAVRDWQRKQRRIGRAEHGHRALTLASPPAEPEPNWDAAWERRKLEFALGRLRAQLEPTAWACFEGRGLRDLPGGGLAAGPGPKGHTVYKKGGGAAKALRQACQDRRADAG